MHFYVTCTDKDGALETRMANREAHLAFVAENTDTIKIGGPFLSEEGAMLGSMLICEADDKESLEAFLANDPYAKAGLFASVEIRPWKWVIGAPA
ncbi:YciI family protein [Cohaesibacter intestini]|uniref:YciI family protein n=1 Tax=Cohaesibacter intestini TaxID=2211145 RepID=UPI000DE96D54|nr:YciI family protein [Cohaesibacter intestini]